MSKQIGTVRVGTALHVEYEGRIRHVIVEEVDDQDNIVVRLGKNSDPTEFAAIRVDSTTIRGFLFEDSPARTLLNEAVWWIDAETPS